MDRQLEADLCRQLLLAAVAARLFELGEQFLNRAMVLLEQRDRVHLLGFRHDDPPDFAISGSTRRHRHRFPPKLGQGVVRSSWSAVSPAGCRFASASWN